MSACVNKPDGKFHLQMLNCQLFPFAEAWGITISSKDALMKTVNLSFTDPLNFTMSLLKGYFNKLHKKLIIVEFLNCYF